MAVVVQVDVVWAVVGEVGDNNQAPTWMINPPGAGKPILAQRLPGILPPLTPAEALGIR